MGYWSRFSPQGAIADFIEQWRQPTPYRWQILGVSVAMTFTLMVLMIPESQRVEPRRPEVTYITTFAPDRTEAEIIQSNIENQKRQDAIEAEQAAREERRREAFRTLGRASGIDVDELEEYYRERLAEDPPAEVTPAPKTPSAD